jgi:hypothetical protein
MAEHDSIKEMPMVKHTFALKLPMGTDCSVKRFGRLAEVLGEGHSWGANGTYYARIDWMGVSKDLAVQDAIKSVREKTGVIAKLVELGSEEG